MKDEAIILHEYGSDQNWGGNPGSWEQNTPLAPSRALKLLARHSGPEAAACRQAVEQVAANMAAQNGPFTVRYHDTRRGHDGVANGGSWGWQPPRIWTDGEVVVREIRNDDKGQIGNRLNYHQCDSETEYVVDGTWAVVIDHYSGQIYEHADEVRMFGPVPPNWRGDEEEGVYEMDAPPAEPSVPAETAMRETIAQTEEPPCGNLGLALLAAGITPETFAA